MKVTQLFTQDERTRQTREQYDSSMPACITDRCHQGDKPCPTPDQCIISLDTSWLGRMIAWFGRWA